MTKLINGSVDSNGVSINYYRIPGEKPPVVLVHGFSDDGLCWNKIPQFLSASYDVTMLDMRGHGLSDKPESGGRYEDMAGDVFAVIRSLNLSKPVVMGHSMGAATAAVLAESYPDWVSGVVLEDPPWHDPQKINPEQQAMFAQGFRKMIEDFKNKTLEEVIASGKQNNPNWDESEFIPWAKAKQLMGLQAFQYITAEQRPWLEIVQHLTVPGLLFTADVERGAIVTPQVADTVKKYWKSGEIVYLDGAGHNIHREQYKRYCDALTNFLKKIF